MKLSSRAVAILVGLLEDPYLSLSAHAGYQIDPILELWGRHLINFTDDPARNHHIVVRLAQGVSEIQVRAEIAAGELQEDSP